MNLDAYFARIGFAATPRTDLETLRAIVRAHVFSVPFENLDVQLKRPLGLETAAIFNKIVERRRGGWCYEQNGLVGWALSKIGFNVTRMSGGVLREKMGDMALGNHLCLLVMLDRLYLVDVGFGGSLTAPLALEEQSRTDAPFHIALGKIDGGFWRFTEDPGSGPFTFDFRAAPADEYLFAEKCAFLQTSPMSPFVQNLVVQKRLPGRHLTLRGRVLKEISAGGETSRILQSADELTDCLARNFNLVEPEAAGLWPAICARHEQVFKEAAATR